MKKQKDKTFIIPPESIIELIHADENTPLWKNEIGRHYKIGYYSEQDGLDVIWLENENGGSETIDREYLFKYFKIIKASRVKDYFGKKK